MTNTDLITIVTSGDSFVDLLLAGGPFAPGATPEPEGAPEIEIEFRGPGALGTVVGTPRGDEFHWGPGGAHAGLNLNPRDRDEDLDVTATGADAFLVAEGRAGNDTIVATPGARVRDGIFSQGGTGDDRLIAPRRSLDILDGGPGNDVIRARGGLDIVSGGAGNDDIAGGPGPDDLEGGRGNDRLSAGRGRDLVLSRDGTRDRVNCGPGRDRVRADRRDRLHRCEATRRA